MTPKTPDYGHKYADKKLAALIKQLKISYMGASAELQDKILKYLERFDKEDTAKRALFDSGEITHEEYMAWRAKKIAGTKQWEQMKAQLAIDMTQQDEIAAAMIKDSLPDIYALNHNYGTYEAEKGSGIDTTYTLYDKYTVKRLAQENQKLLPDPKVDIDKDKQWNAHHLQSALLRGILTGDSMQGIADQFAAITNMNANAAIRNARTAVTGAENAGRMDSYNRAASMGIQMYAVWMATLDNRTRDTHAMMDGRRLSCNEIQEGARFENGLRYPGDPTGMPSEVYNCRCTLVAKVEGADIPVMNDNRPSELVTDYWSYGEWIAAHNTDETQLKMLESKAWGSNYDLKEIEPYIVKSFKVSKVATKSLSLYIADDGYFSSYALSDYISDRRKKLQETLAILADPADIAEYQQYLKNLDELEKIAAKYGDKYSKLKKQALDDADAYAQALRKYNLLKKPKPTYQAPGTGPFSQQRKDAAKWFTQSEYVDADLYYDPEAIDIFYRATKAEWRAYYEYTSASGGINRPLAGFEAPKYSGGSGWDQKYYKGPGNVDFDNEGKGEDIKNLTSLIEKSNGYSDDVWLQTGQGMQFLEGFLGQKYGSMSKMTEADLQQFVGERREIPQFLSTSINRGGGSYTPGDVIVNIYCPAGSKMLYVQDDGGFGKTEHEMILQRGGTYAITKIYWGQDDYGGTKLFVDMDLHNELGYNLYEN